MKAEILQFYSDGISLKVKGIRLRITFNPKAWTYCYCVSFEEDWRQTFYMGDKRLLMTFLEMLENSHFRLFLKLSRCLSWVTKSTLTERYVYRAYCGCKAYKEQLENQLLRSLATSIGRWKNRNALGLLRREKRRIKKLFSEHFYKRVEKILSIDWESRWKAYEIKRGLKR